MYNRNYCYLDFGLVFLSGACVKADAATLLTIFGVLGLLNNFPAFDATLLDVCSFLAIMNYKQ